MSGIVADRSTTVNRNTGVTTGEMFGEFVRMKQTEKAQGRISLYRWSLRVPEPKRGPLDFKLFPFQKELYGETAGDKELVVKKATQVGVSTWMLRWALYWADVKGLTCLYIFPTATDVYDFSDARVKPAIDGSDYLRKRVPAGLVQNKGLKAIGTGFVYFRGSESKRRLDSVDADILALDEYDTLVQENIGDAERRIGGSLVGLTRRIGVPSLTDYGIEREWLRSDMRRWMVKCEHCNDWQYVTFDNIEWDRQRTDAPFGAHLICRKCRKKGIDVLKGQWVAEKPDVGMRGYHMPRMIVGHADLDAIVKASMRKEPYMVTVHKNKDLAEAHDGEGNRVTKEEIAAAQREFPMVSAYTGDNPVTMGIDVASTRALSVRISEHLTDSTKKCLWMGEVDSFDDVVKLMDLYRVKMACVDHLPEGRLAMGLAEQFPGRVYLVNFATQDDVLKINEEMRRVSVRRTEVLDATIHMVRAQNNLLPKYLPDNYVSEMMAPVRKIEKDQETGKVTVTYVSTGPDDMMFAEAYDLVATEVWYLRQGVEALQRDSLQPLEEMMEFKRSGLGDPDEVDYSEGLEDGSYDMDNLMSSFD